MYAVAAYSLTCHQHRRDHLGRSHTDTKRSDFPDRHVSPKRAARRRGEQPAGRGVLPVNIGYVTLALKYGDEAQRPCRCHRESQHQGRPCAAGVRRHALLQPLRFLEGEAESPASQPEAPRASRAIRRARACLERNAVDSISGGEWRVVSHTFVDGECQIAGCHTEHGALSFLAHSPLPLDPDCSREA